MNKSFSWVYRISKALEDLSIEDFTYLPSYKTLDTKIEHR